MDHVQFRELALAAPGISAVNVSRDNIDRRYRLFIRTSFNIQFYESQHDRE
jgi:hypothetical protein